MCFDLLPAEPWFFESHLLAWPVGWGRAAPIHCDSAWDPAVLIATPNSFFYQQECASPLAQDPASPESRSDQHFFRRAFILP